MYKSLACIACSRRLQHTFWEHSYGIAGMQHARLVVRYFGQGLLSEYLPDMFFSNREIWDACRCNKTFFRCSPCLPAWQLLVICVHAKPFKANR